MKSILGAIMFLTIMPITPFVLFFISIFIGSEI
jgi:hypothetical protein